MQFSVLVCMMCAGCCDLGNGVFVVHGPPLMPLCVYVCVGALMLPKTSSVAQQLVLVVLLHADEGGCCHTTGCHTTWECPPYGWPSQTLLNSPARSLRTARAVRLVGKDCWLF